MIRFYCSRCKQELTLDNKELEEFLRIHGDQEIEVEIYEHTILVKLHFRNIKNEEHEEEEETE